MHKTANKQIRSFGCIVMAFNRKSVVTLEINVSENKKSSKTFELIEGREENCHLHKNCCKFQFKVMLKNFVC